MRVDWRIRRNEKLDDFDRRPLEQVQTIDDESALIGEDRY